MTTTITDVRAANPKWFDPKTKRFMGDISYRILHGKTRLCVNGHGVHKPHLVRKTYAWTDMFGQPKKAHWRVNRLEQNESGEWVVIGPLVDDIFPTLDDVKEWLKEN